MAVRRAVLLLGKCMSVSRENGVEVAVTMREMDTYLTMYFPEVYTFFAYDAKEECKPGDIILLQKRDEPLTRKITHQVLKVVYKYGDVTDPLTGKKVAMLKYRDHLEHLDQTFNTSDSGFTNYVFKKRHLEKFKPTESTLSSQYIRRRQRTKDSTEDEPNKN